MSWSRYLSVRRAEGERFLWRRRQTPGVDYSYGDPRLAAIRAAGLEGADGWAVIREQLAGAAADADGSPAGGEELAFLAGGLQTVSGVERWIGDVIAAAPGDPLPLLVSGVRHIGWAWHSRAWLETRDVTESQAKLFRDRLTVAEQQLAAVAEREPAWAAPWYFRQISARGLDLGQEVAERRFQETVRRAPGHVAAHRERLQQLTSRWGGSQEQMHAFAQQAAFDAPEGSALGQLVALAHLEEWVDRGADPESSYLQSGRVLGSLHEAAERSVFQPEFVRTRDWAIAFNAFAMAFSLAGDQIAARAMFRVLGDRVTEMPWQYLDERSPMVAFRGWRNEVQ
jgi:hypothetical protein